MLNWRRDPDYERRKRLREQQIKQIDERTRQIEKETEQIKGTSKNTLLQRINGHEKAAIRRHCNRTPHDDYSNTSLGSRFNA
jgi:t-SNARE complex subunit (syntaxin)